MYQQLQRRPIKLRSAPFAVQLSSFLVRMGVTANQVSIMSLVFALTGAGLLFLSSTDAGIVAHPATAAIALTLAAVCIQLRLLCNLVDGLMAVECGKSTKCGELFNEFPDRISDVALLVCAGYAAQSGAFGVNLGWLSAVLALLTAYIRAFGSRYSKSQDYSGPMAKQHRMLALTIGSVLAALSITFFANASVMLITLLVICFGSIITCIRRTARLAQTMEQQT